MNETSSRLLYWTPRVLCIAFAAFLSIFAMDVFSMPVDFPHKVLALGMHLIPTGIVLVTLAVVWRREWIGAVVFPLLAVYHLATTWGRLDGSGYVMIEVPLLLLGVLFLVNWRARVALKPSVR